MLSRFAASRPSTVSSIIVACLATAQAAHAGVSVHATFLLSTIRFAPADPEGYFLFPGLQASGFVDDANQNNYIRLESNDHEFGTDLYPARGVGTGTLGSIVSQNVPELVGRINTGTGWTLTVVDGTTNQTRTYSLTVSTPGIAADYIRPMTLNVTPDSVISDAPSFTWGEPAHTSPGSAWTSAFGGLYANNWQNNVFSPAFGPADLAWTPDAPLNPDTYTLGISKVNDAPPQTLLTVSSPVPQGGAPALTAFTKQVRAQSDANASNLVVPCSTPGPAVALEFTPGVISFSPLEPDVYILGIGITGTGFVDDNNEENFLELHSANDHYSSDFYPALGHGSGTAGSIGQPDAATLQADVNSEGPWTLRVTDGTTHNTSTYTFAVTASALAGGYLRPIVLDVNPGDAIESNQTFTWTQAPALVPGSQNTSAFGGAIAEGNPSNSVFSPGFGPDDSSWTPDAPLGADLYTFLVAKVNDAPPQTLVVAGTPASGPGACALSGFTQRVRIQESAQSSHLVVTGGGCDSIDFNHDDLFPDTADIDDFLSVFSGGPCSNDPNCGDVDFNNDDLFPDTMDIDSLLSVFSGGPCL
ncbi:MAG: hypothetical protein U0637_03120 [Phycisphaerales bacterium]